MPACRSAPAAAMPAIPAPTIAILGDGMTRCAPALTNEGGLTRASDPQSTGADGGMVEYSFWPGGTRKLVLYKRCALHGKFNRCRKAASRLVVFRRDEARCRPAPLPKPALRLETPFDKLTIFVKIVGWAPRIASSRLRKVSSPGLAFDARR